MDSRRDSQEDSVSDITSNEVGEISDPRDYLEGRENAISLLGSSDERRDSLGDFDHLSDVSIQSPDSKASLDAETSKPWLLGSNELPLSPFCRSRTLLLCLWGVLSISVPLVLIGLGVAAVLLSKAEVKGNSWGATVSSVLQRSATIYPILFAAVVGQAVRSTARFGLERGARILTLETLMGSQTVTSTISTLFQLRAICFTTAFLMILWTLSPLGGFGFAQMLQTTDEWSNSTQDISYLNLSSRNWLGWQGGNYTSNSTQDISYLNLSSRNWIGWQGGNYTSELVPEAVSDGVDALYKVSASNWEASERKSQDPMGNVKIPRLEVLNGTSKGADDWISIPAVENTAYSSLLGVPVFNPPAADNYSFTLQSSYYRFDCGKIRTVDATNASWIYQLGEYWRERALEYYRNNTKAAGNITKAGLYPMFGCQTATDETCLRSTPFLDTHTDLSGGISGPINITFGSLATRLGPTSVTLVNCSLIKTDVESKVRCSGPEGCSVTHMRQFKMGSVLGKLPDRLSDPGTMFGLFSVFPKASIGILERYIMGRPLDMVNGTDVNNEIIDCDHRSTNGSCCSSEDFGQRFGTLFNSYWMACYGLSVMSAHMPSRVGSSANAAASIMTHRERYATNFFWLCTTFFSLTFLLVVSIAGTILRFHCISPDILGYVSSHTRDNPYIPLQSGGCALDGLDRSRLLKDLRVQVRDVKPDGLVGHIAIAAVGYREEAGEGASGKLARHRQYAG